MAALLPLEMGHAKGEKNKELVILTWSDYLDPEVLQEFETSKGVTIRQVSFDSDQARDQLVVRKGSDAFDIMVVNSINLPVYARQNWLTPIDTSKIANSTHLESRWLADAEYSGKLFGIPYFWGNIGLGYREDLVATPPTGWLDFFRPAEGLHGRLNAMATNRELFGIALKALGYSVNSEKPEELEEAEKLLLQQKAHVKSYIYLDINKESPLVTGEIAMAMLYNGDALKLQEFNNKTNYINPKEGSAMWVDYLALGTGSARRELAMAFLNFMQDPTIAMRNAQSLHFATPNREALRLSSPAYRNNPIIFPPEEVLRLSETIRPVAARTQRRINDVVARLLR
ncbi:MAG: spermidine/putrescine ABC transporter substrate-binding protein [Magnetococcus sp. YQC-5]